MPDAILVQPEALPEYSVLMAVYHGDMPEWFEEAIESMANQSLPPREIVVVEDGQLTEGLYDAERRCRECHPELIRIVTLEQGQGLAAAMRYGLLACSCEWIARMDADDVSDLTRCEEELRMAEAEHADIVGCDCEEFFDSVQNPAAKRLFPATHDELVRFSRRRSPFCHPAVMMRKSAILDAGNYRDVHLHEDYDLFVRMLARGYRGCCVKKILFHSRIGRDYYGRRGGVQYVRTLLGYNVQLLRSGWMRPSDFIMRSCGNILVGLAPVTVRSWFYRRLLRK